MNCCNVKGWWCLGLAGVTVIVVWTIVLPWIGSRPSIRARIDDLNRQGIDAAALFYTDLEAMGRIESEMAAIRQAQPDAFWSLASTGAE